MTKKINDIKYIVEHKYTRENTGMEEAMST